MTEMSFGHENGYAFNEDQRGGHTPTLPCPECGGSGTIIEPFFGRPEVTIPCPECSRPAPSVADRLAAVTEDLGRIVARLEDLLREVR
jgi:hypothetical protein